MTTEVWLTYGLSASGKSTWAKAQDGLVRISMDDVRATLGCPSGSPKWTRDFEGMAFKVMLGMAKEVARQGHGIILDNTHLSPSMPTQIAKAFRQQDVVFKVKDFTHVSKDECARRDALRPDGVRVGAEVINRQEKTRRTAKLQGKPFVLTEEWLNGFRLNVTPWRPGQHILDKPKAVIFDVDGTLTLGPVYRSPYDTTRVLTDPPRRQVIDLAQMFKRNGYQVLVCSGRSSVCRADTAAWLVKHQVPFDRIWMREAGDTRSDDIVKLEIFDHNIRDHYNVEQVFDDRDQVVSLWRKLGLQCNQVAEGAF